MSSTEWIEHRSDSCPVALSAMVEVRCGEDTLIGRAQSFAWSQSLEADEGRITHYRPWPDVPGEVEVVVTPGPAAAVGDLTSNAPGTAARFNPGKAPLHLIPAGILADAMGHAGRRPEPELRRAVAWDLVLVKLGHFQMLALPREAARCALLDALCLLNVEPGAWAESAAVFDYGQRKYSAWNWAKGQAWSVPLGSALRHILFGIYAGETHDPESGLAHRGHVVCNVVMLLWFLDHYPEGNDLRVLPV